MTIQYQDVFTVNIADTTREAQIRSILSQIQSTTEGQLLFGRIQNSSGSVDIIEGNIIDGTPAPTEYRSGSNPHININWDQLDHTKFSTPLGLFQPSLNGVMIHEIFHAANRPYYNEIPSGPNSTVPGEELSATIFTNIFSSKYWKDEPMRLTYEEGVYSPFSSAPISYYSALDPNPNFSLTVASILGVKPEDLLSNLGDPPFNEFRNSFQNSDGSLQYFEDNFHNYDIRDHLENAGGTAPNDVEVGTIGDQVFSFIGDAAETIINGVPYVVREIAESIEATGEAVSKFINNLVDQNTDWFKSETGAQASFATWFALNLDDLLSGDISADEAFVGLVKQLVQDRISFAAAQAITTSSDAEDALAGAIESVFNIHGSEPRLDANGNQIFNQDGTAATITHAEMYATAVRTALFSMAAQFVLNGFDAEQAAKAGLAAMTAQVAATYLKIDGFSLSQTGAATAAITTAVIGLLESGEFDSSDWLQLGAQVGIAAGSAYAGAEIASIILDASVGSGNPVAIVVATVIALAANKIIGKLFGSAKFGAGEFGSVTELMNSIYQVQTITVNGQSVPALVAVSQSGSTILASGSGIGYILGNIGADVLVGDGNVQTISANGGADYLEARGGNDNLLGGTGSDHLNGGDGNDVLQGDAGEDILFGEDGADTALGGAGQDFIHMGSGDDIAAGGTGNDYILAGGGADAVAGDAGNDTLDGGYGDDSIDGGDGNDLVLGNLGNDYVDGSDGSDTLFGDAGNDQIYGGNGNDFIDGGDGIDILHGDAGRDLIVGGAGDDFAEGGLGDDNILGGTGNDVILGGLDDDYIRGDEGNDSITGGFGNDIMVGGVGSNTLTGEDGSDVYVIGSDVNEHHNVIVDSGATAGEVEEEELMLAMLAHTQLYALRAHW